MRRTSLALAVLTLLAADLRAEVFPHWFEVPPPASIEPRRVTPIGYEGLEAPGEPIAPDSYGYACNNRCAYVQADALYWHRIGNGCDDLLVQNTTTGDPLLDSGDL